MLIDKKKWDESFIDDKIKFVESVFYIANVDSNCVSKDDLIIMCDFLLQHVHELKCLNAEMRIKFEEIRGGKEQ